jgi:hypothetical protein
MKIQSATGLATNLWMGRFDKARPPEGSGTQEDHKTTAKQRHASRLQEREHRTTTGRLNDSNKNGRMAGRQQPQDISMTIQSVTGLATNLWLGRFDKVRPPEGSKGRLYRMARQQETRRKLYRMARQQETRRNELTRTSGKCYSKERMPVNPSKGCTRWDPPAINGTTRGAINRVTGLATNLWFGRFDKARPPERIEDPLNELMDAS